MVEFLVDNTIWVIVGAIVLVMALIGYFAENSELGKKVMQPKKPKAPKTQKTKEPKKPQTIEEAKELLDKNAGLATAVSDAGSLNQDALNQPEGDIPGVLDLNSDDAWSNNVNTDASMPTEVVQSSTDEWLNGPMAQADGDALFNMPGSGGLSEVQVESLPTGNYSNVEVLDFDLNENDYNNIEVLDFDFDDEMQADTEKMDAEQEQNKSEEIWT